MISDRLLHLMSPKDIKVQNRHSPSTMGYCRLEKQPNVLVALGPRSAEDILQNPIKIAASHVF